MAADTYREQGGSGFTQTASISVYLQGWLKSMRANEKAMLQPTRQALYFWAEGLLGRFKRERLMGPPGVSTKSGLLRKSWRHRESGKTLVDMQTKVWTTAKYARLLEFGSAGLPGGVIRPKKAQMLAIPIKGGPAMTKRGHQIYHSPLRQHLPRELDFFVARRKADGKLFLMDKRGRAWFTLVHSVRVLPKLGFIAFARKEINKLRDIMATKWQEALKRG